MKISDIDDFIQLKTKLKEAFIDNPVDTRHIDIDPDTKVGLVVNGEVVRSDKFTRIISYLKTTEDTGTFIVSKDGIELLRVNL